MDDINTWPGWECVRQLGAGSFGKVYEIQREERGKVYKAALKVMTIPFSQSEIREAYSEGMTEQNVTEYFQEFVESITEEFALMSEFKGQSNIVSYEDHMVLKHEEGIGWDILIRMELLTPLSEWHDRHPLNEADVIALGSDVCHALELCWQKRIVHRDIKPENIFVNEYGDYKLGDFGIARTVEKTMATLSQKGTYTYIAPEVYKGQEYGQTADIYSLGLVLYRYLNERRMPFMPTDGTIRYSDRDESFKRRICGEQIPPPANGSQALKEVILKSVAYAPEERYQSAHEFREALKGCKSEIDGTTWLFPPRERKEQKEPTRRTEIIQNPPEPVEEPSKSVDKDKKKQMFIIGLYGIIGLLAGGFVIAMAGRGTKQDNLSRLPDIPKERTVAESTETEQSESVTQTVTETVTDDEQMMTERETEDVESTAEEAGTFWFREEPSTYGRTSVLLVGDTTELWMSDGHFILLPESANMKWTSSNEAIATISSRGVVTGISPGVVELTGACDGEQGKPWQMTIVQEDKNSGVTVSADYERFSLGANASETVMLTLHGTVADQIGAVCYASSGLDLRFSWGGVIDGSTIPLNFENTFGTSADEGDITVLFYRENEPEKIIAKTMIHVKVK